MFPGSACITASPQVSPLSKHLMARPCEVKSSYETNAQFPAASAVAPLSHACASTSLFFSPQTVTNVRSFQEASVEEARRIYRAEQVVLHSPVVHLQQKTPGHIFFLSSFFYGRLLYGAGRFPILA